MVQAPCACATVLLVFTWVEKLQFQTSHFSKTGGKMGAVKSSISKLGGGCRSCHVFELVNMLCVFSKSLSNFVKVSI